MATNYVQTAGNAAKAPLSKLFSTLGLLSSVGFAFFIYIILYPHPYVRYVPDLSTTETVMYEMGQLGMLAIGYLAIQFLAMLTRGVGSAWGELGDLLFSLLPLFVIYGAWTNVDISTFTAYQHWAMIILGGAAVVDVVIVTVTVFRLLLMANDFVSR